MMSPKYREPVDFPRFLDWENCPFLHCGQLTSVFSMEFWKSCTGRISWAWVQSVQTKPLTLDCLINCYFSLLFQSSILLYSILGKLCLRCFFLVLVEWRWGKSECHFDIWAGMGLSRYWVCPCGFSECQYWLCLPSPPSLPCAHLSPYRQVYPFFTEASPSSESSQLVAWVDLWNCSIWFKKLQHFLQDLISFPLLTLLGFGLFFVLITVLQKYPRGAAVGGRGDALEPHWNQQCPFKVWRDWPGSGFSSQVFVLFTLLL